MKVGNSTCANHKFDIETGLYFGNKNSYTLKIKIYLFLE